ncbi:MAG: ribonuclease P [Candidatus Thermoplasmatota archaeon]|nr:ribonuclease P [Candidatus Thermoplasmatota archaeon]MBU1941930.1 ribonuclease P [Candidatus Thermoplasmatota archaeon]
MNRMHAKRKKQHKEIAAKRITMLLQQAEQMAMTGRFTYANRYVELARKISMRYLVPIPPEFKQHICSHCYHYLLPGRTVRTRIHRGQLISYCLHCHQFMRMPLHQKKTLTTRKHTPNILI